MCRSVAWMWSLLSAERLAACRCLFAWYPWRVSAQGLCGQFHVSCKLLPARETPATKTLSAAAGTREQTHHLLLYTTTCGHCLSLSLWVTEWHANTFTKCNQSFKIRPAPLLSAHFCDVSLPSAYSSEAGFWHFVWNLQSPICENKQFVAPVCFIVSAWLVYLIVQRVRRGKITKSVLICWVSHPVGPGLHLRCPS